MSTPPKPRHLSKVCDRAALRSHCASAAVSSLALPLTLGDLYFTLRLFPCRFEAHSVTVNAAVDPTVLLRMPRQPLSRQRSPGLRGRGWLLRVVTGLMTLAAVQPWSPPGSDRR
jgi:hypothetical protein